MKKLLVVTIGLFFSFMGYSQSCLPDGITFERQSQIDSFQINYPFCTMIEGDVQIGDYFSSDVSNLSGLSVLTSIEGDLSIGNEFQGNPYLSSLTGLDNLISIEGNLSIQHNAITNLIGLNNMIYVDSILIQMNPSLINLTGLDAMNSIEGDLYIRQNYALVSLTGLENLTSIGGNLTIYHNYDLTSLIGLEGLNSIGGKLDIEGNVSLTSLSGLDNINAASITDLTIYNNTTLSTCAIQSICDYLSIPNGIVNIYNNASGCNNPPEIADYCGITISCMPFGNYYFVCQDDIDNFQINYPNCSQLEGNVTIEGNSITNLNGLNSISSIGGDVTFHQNDSLTCMTGLDGLTFIGGNLKIYYNVALNNLNGLESLESIGGFLDIERNNSLPNLTGLNSLNFVGGSLDLKKNDSLQNLLGLEGLTSIGDYLSISVNKDLTSLEGLNALNSIGDYLAIHSNDSLNNLTGLFGLSSIGDFLMVTYNHALFSLQGLDNISPGSISNLFIFGNSTLSICEVKSICDYLVSPNGNIDISDNSLGCNSQSEVEEACEVGVDESISDAFFAIFPNPTSSQITIKIPTTKQKEIGTQLCIYNTNSQLLITRMLTGQSMVINISDLAKGIYYVKLTSDSNVNVFKIVKK